jgi:hypothetical protein
VRPAETVSRTTTGHVDAGTRLNLERVKVGDELGGTLLLLAMSMAWGKCRQLEIVATVGR